MNSSYHFTEEHTLFRQGVRQFFQKEVAPFIDEWEKAGEIPKPIWKKMGDMGYWGLNFPAKYGGSDVDFFYTVVLIEETARLNCGGFAAASGVTPYMAGAHILGAGSDYLKEKYLPKSISGEWLGALAISEPNAGSDVANIRTKAEKIGNEYVINGTKTFITNGVLSDYIVTAVKTERNQLSLIVIDRTMQGISATKLDKLGWHSSDTGEIHLDNVRVPVENLVGQEGRGFYYIMDRFQIERLIMAIGGVATASFALEYALQYMASREAFGKKINQFQALRHRIADLASEIEAVRYFVYHVCRMQNEGKYAVKEASMAKLLATELADKATYQCLQFFGGYGFIEDFKIARAFRDSRIGTIGGGSSEIMREIIAKMVIDEVQYNNGYQTDENADTRTAREIILSFPKRFNSKKAQEKNYQAIFHFDLQGDAGGKFTIKIDGANCQVSEGWEDTPICIVETETSTYEAMEKGKLNPQEALMSGKINVSNLMEMMKLGGFLRK